MRAWDIFFRERYQELVHSQLDWKLNLLSGPSGPKSLVNGKEVILVCSNNYLNLTNHPRLKEAAIKAIREYGVGAGSAREIAGNMDLHVELERHLAKFKETEASLVFPSGFSTNIGLIPQLVGQGDLVLSDELNHGSIIDGIRLSGAERQIYRHGDMNDLQLTLEASGQKDRRILIITDGVFSMDGDIAPLDRIYELAQQYHALTYVDDAHGDFVLGEKGRGTVSRFHLVGKIDVDMGTMSKALGGLGGFVAGSTDLVNYAYNKSRSWLLTTSLPPAVVAACTEAIEVLEREPHHLAALWRNTEHFKGRMKSLGFDTGKSETPIIPVIVGEPAIARELAGKLFDAGVFALPIVYPMVAKNKSRIRVQMNAGLSIEEISFVVDAFEFAGKEMKII